jgi:hypothetical protein
MGFFWFDFARFDNPTNLLSVPHPPHKGAARNTDGFSLEKITKVKK